MAATTPFMSFLRPMGLPRPATLRQFMRFSTSTPCLEAREKREDRNLVASRTAPASYPPKSMKSLPRPKESRASHRTNHPKVERHYPTRGVSHDKPVVQKLIPDPVTPLAPHLCAPNLPYFVTRTPSNHLPIYTLRKAGGNKLVTRIKKVDGKSDVLRDELKELLGLAEKEAVINRTTGHIMIKGHHGPKIEHFLKQRAF